MTSLIGQSLPRVDAPGKVTGETLYPGDISMPGMLHMKIMFAGRPHARILRINVSQAETVAGVVRVFTSSDVPVNEYGLQINDQPVLCGPTLPESPSKSNESQENGRVDASVVRFIGDQVAAVVAETEEIAAQAMSFIEVEYEDLPILSDPEVAILPDAPLLHPERGKTNVCVHYKIRKGDITAGFQQADVIVEDEYRVPAQEHAYLQPEAGVAYYDDGAAQVVVKAAGQWTHTDAKQIAHSLGLRTEQIRVQYPAIGGAFGGREDLSVQILLALAAWQLKRPIKIIWSRKESIIGHAKRHPMIIRAKWGATKEGKLVAAENTFIADGGAYMYTSNKVLGNSTITQTGPYYIPNVKADVLGVYTNNIPSAAFRGFGAPQALFMAETQMNKLAEKLGLDPVEFRMRNILTEFLSLGVDTPPPAPVTIGQVIETAAARAGWKKDDRGWIFLHETQPTVPTQKPLVRGIGFAAGFKNIGFSFGYKENCWARVELHGGTEIEGVVLWHAAAEVGQGVHTALAQMAAEIAGVPVSAVQLITMDTVNMGDSGSASASRLTFMAGNSVRGAAQAAKEKWLAEERPAVAEYTYYAPPTTPMDHETGKSMPNFAYAYAAQAVEVEVDTETGQVRLVRVISADDVGKAVNPALVEGQIEGGVVQAMGYAIQENFISKEGRVLTDQLSTYLLPTILDIPESVESLVVEIPDERGPWGAKGLGELPYLPLAPAIVAAIHDATGIWINTLPLTPEHVLRSLGGLA